MEKKKKINWKKVIIGFIILLIGIFSFLIGTGTSTGEALTVKFFNQFDLCKFGSFLSQSFLCVSNWDIVWYWMVFPFSVLIISVGLLIILIGFPNLRG